MHTVTLTPYCYYYHIILILSDLSVSSVIRELVLYSYPNSLIRLANSPGGLRMALPIPLEPSSSFQPYMANLDGNDDVDNDDEDIDDEDNDDDIDNSSGISRRDVRGNNTRCKG